MCHFPQRVVVLKLDHRPERDKRLTSHVGLTARAFGTNGFWVGGLQDPKIEETIKGVSENWGHQAFEVQTGISWKKKIRLWKTRGGEVIHLTMYGKHLDKMISRILKSDREKLVIVGGPKVPSEIFTLADYNVAIGHQPHSEVAALALFLDRLSRGKALYFQPTDAKLKIIPQEQGKNVDEQDS
jgi:tRNA (cytidine56-2'-O)-methyltransferase